MASREKTESRVFRQRTFQTLPAVLFTKCQLLLSGVCAHDEGWLDHILRITRKPVLTRPRALLLAR